MMIERPFYYLETNFLNARKFFNDITASKDNCKYLGLKKLSEQYEMLIEKANASNTGFKDFICDIVQMEADARRERSIKYHIRESRLPQPYKLLADFNFSFQPGLKKKLVMDLSTMDFMRQRESVLFIGNCGTGKSHLARGLGLIACEKGYKSHIRSYIPPFNKSGNQRSELSQT